MASIASERYTLPGRNDADRRLFLFHDPDLHPGGLGAEKNVIVNIEGVLGVAGRMVFGDVQRLEIVVVGLHLGPFRHFKAHGAENIAQLLLHLGKGMPCSQPRCFSGGGNVHPFRLQLDIPRRRFQLCRLFGEFFLKLGADFVGECADDRTLLGGKSAHAAENRGQLSFFTEIPDAQLLRGGAPLQKLLRFFPDREKFFFHTL